MGKHAEWRKVAKKLRRKRIRTVIAVARDQKLKEEQKTRENSPTYKQWLEEQAILETYNLEEEKRLAMERQQLWQAEEETALLRWREQQSRIAHAKAEKFKREIMIKEDWEREQRKIQEAEEARKKSEDEKKRKQAELLAQIDAFIEGKAELPEEVNVCTQTQPGHPDCPFFSKTGACRFRDSCSRNHNRPGISRILLIPNFYDHFGLTTLHHDEYDTDLSLEYEDSETYQHFKEFYKDVLPEFEQCGRLTQFKICNNEEPHLRGNVYVEFQSRRNALKAYRIFQGRFYAGRRLNVEFTNIPSWKNAICGLFHRRKCPKGKTCNFLHVFRNPNDAFKIQDGHSSSRRQFSRSRSRSPRERSYRSRSKEWNWSEGSGSENESRQKKMRSPRVRSRNLDTDSDNERSRSRSPSRNKMRSRNDFSTDRKKKYHRDRKQDRRMSRSPYRDRRRDEKYQSTSRSPRYDRKRYLDDSQDGKEKNGDMKREKGKDFDKRTKKLKDEEIKSSKEKYYKEENSKGNKKERSDKNDKPRRKMTEETQSSSRYNLNSSANNSSSL